jgi:hypothetical protein
VGGRAVGSAGEMKTPRGSHTRGVPPRATAFMPTATVNGTSSTNHSRQMARHGFTRLHPVGVAIVFRSRSMTNAPPTPCRPVGSKQRARNNRRSPGGTGRGLANPAGTRWRHDPGRLWCFRPCILAAVFVRLLPQHHLPCALPFPASRPVAHLAVLAVMTLMVMTEP